jgi:hypothetical protein
MTARRYSDRFLDEMRAAGDPLADAAIADVFEAGEVDAVNTVMKTLVRNDGVPAKKLPRAVRDYLDATDDLPEWADPQRIVIGERFFELHGPFCVLALATASLPACYAMRRGVQVLALTARLHTDPVRRIGETAQMTLHAMAPGGLAAGGAGVRDAQKVRLMHAAVRHLALASDDWDPDWGTPVNQEDLAFTLLTFSLVVLDAIRKLGRTFSDEEADAYFHCWNCVGHVLGVDRRLIAPTIAGSRRLWRRITERNREHSAEGTMMTEALIGAMEHAVPGTVFDGFPAYLVRYIGGDELADILDVPGRGWTSVLSGPLRLFARASDALGDASPVVEKAAAHFSTQLLEGFGWVARDGERAPFDIPQHLAERWDVRGASAL